MWAGVYLAYKDKKLVKYLFGAKADNEEYIKQYCTNRLNEYVKSPEFNGQIDEAFLLTINLETFATLVPKSSMIPPENLM